MTRAKGRQPVKREAMDDREARFIEGEVAPIDLSQRHLTPARGDFAEDIPYDYLVIALGRRLRTERAKGFFEHAHHREMAKVELGNSRGFTQRR